jgi:hypothetical protein
MVYQAKVQNMDHLKEGIRDACPRITPDMLKQFAISGKVASLWAVNVMVSIKSTLSLNKQTIIPAYVYFWIPLYNIVDSLV